MKNLFFTTIAPGAKKWNSHLLKNYFICFHESVLKMMKSVFYFILKAFYFSMYLQ